MKIKPTTLTILGIIPILLGITISLPTVLAKFPPEMNKPKSSLTKAQYANGKLRAADAAKRVKPRLKQELKVKNLTFGSPIFIRIFKQTHELELWIKSPSNKFTHFKTYKIAAMSGALGPKLKEGDRQAPEGFYFVKKSQMNPQSRFHLSFNLGYPNSYDRAHHRTGSALMIHGNRVSIGCFAMTDYYIEEIYTLCDAALKNGQPYFRVHSFPFRLTPENLRRHSSNKWHTFWQELKPGYDHFENHKTPPNIITSNKKYQIG